MTNPRSVPASVNHCVNWSHPFAAVRVPPSQEGTSVPVLFLPLFLGAGSKKQPRTYSQRDFSCFQNEGGGVAVE